MGSGAAESAEIERLGTKRCLKNRYFQIDIMMQKRDGRICINLAGIGFKAGVIMTIHIIARSLGDPGGRIDFDRSARQKNSRLWAINRDETFALPTGAFRRLDC